MLATRRALMGWTAASVSLGSSGIGALQAAPGTSTKTPPEDIGPFYPVVTPAESSIDLTRVPGRADRALGAPFDLTTVILSRTGEPVRGAMVLVWHASADGVYGHPGDFVKKPSDQGFLGHALMRTDRDGAVKIRSVRPGSYPDMPGTFRTPHIHFEVIGEESRLITQMYFPGEPLNAKDRLIAEMKTAGRDPDALICRAVGTDANRYLWEVVLESR